MNTLSSRLKFKITQTAVSEPLLTAIWNLLLQAVIDEETPEFLAAVIDQLAIQLAQAFLVNTGGL